MTGSQQLKAAVAQLVEHHVANVNVTSSSLVSRSNFSRESTSPTVDENWRVGRVAMQRIANPWTSIRLRDPPPLCPGGGIGRHTGFKIPRLNGRAGSSPAPGTIFIN